ncbi:hypothetical protein SUGI_0117210 [Cryptomeria japonica]|nr:hypothetical protein SUGI_0117210 [Cryptomeria japonica]
MGKYRLIEKLGEGGYGTVWKAINKWTDEVVAIKRLQKKKNDRFYESLFKEEEKSLRALQHPNIVSLRDTYKEGGHLHIVLEYMDSDLWRIIKNRKEPSLSRTVQRLCFKILKALEYMHGLGYCHRDLKPENLLLKGNNIKISDFGLAINLKEKMEKNEPLDPNVATIAYKAPELLLKSSSYDFAIDMWSLGVIIAQFYGLEPIFGSRSDWRNQIYNICSVIGCPNEKTWPEGLKLAESLDYQFPKEFDGENCRKNLRRLMLTASEEVIDLVKHLCSWDPKRRPTTNSVLSRNVVFYGSEVFNSEKEEISIQGCVGRISRNSKEMGSARISTEKGSGIISDRRAWR